MPEWTETGLLRTWSALAEPKGSEEWRLADLARFGDATVMAGRKFPGSREALVLAFASSPAGDRSLWPQGDGFDLEQIEAPAPAVGEALALVRQAEGSLDIFALMSVDLLQFLSSVSREGKRDIATSLISRIREWQSFMARRRKALSPDAQVGLFGELWLLKRLLESQLGAEAIQSWQGPLRAAQDFHVSGAAIEVKSTVGTRKFLARINSIEQLDSEREPLFLCALNFLATDEGVTLPEFIEQLREWFAAHGALKTFDALLLVMGYSDEHAAAYGTRYSLDRSRSFRMCRDSPRLMRADLPKAIRAARYVLDIDAIEQSTITIDEMLGLLGVGPHES